jgi:hypothetical protein
MKRREEASAARSSERAKMAERSEVVPAPV